MTLFLALLVVIAALAWVTLVGWSVTRLVAARLSPEETVSWSFAIGILLHVSLYATLLTAKASPGPTKLFVGEAIVFGASLLAARRRQGRESSPMRFPAAGVLLATLAAGPYALDVLGSPLDSTDFLAIWGWKAKLIFSSGGIPSRLFHDPFTVWSHPVYPLFVPLCLASFAAVLRRFDARALFLLYPALEAATLLALFGYLRRKGSLLAATVGAAAAALCYPLYRSPWAGTAEVPMAFALVMTAIAAFQIQESDSWSNRILVLIGSTLCVTVKQEGSLFVILLAVWTLGRSISPGEMARPAARRAWIWFLLPVVAQAVGMRILRGTVARHDFDFTLLTASRLPEWLASWQTVLAHLARVQIAGAALPIAGLIGYLLLTRPRREDWLLVILGFQTLSYAAAASLSAFGPIWGLESAFVRTTLTLMPTLALVLGARAEFLRRPPAPA